MKKDQPGITERTLTELGKCIPGLGSLLKIAQASPAFKEKFKEKDAEIAAKLGEEANHQERENKRKERKAGPDREPQVDIFEEEEYLRVIVELPGLNEEEINLQLQGKALLISTGKFHRKIPLAFSSPAAPLHTYQNGILEVKVLK